MAIHLEKDCWDIIDSYFDNVPNYISKNQIDSFNMFLDEQIGKTVRQFNPIQLVYEKENMNRRYEIDITIGGTLQQDDKGNPQVVNDGRGIFIGKPTIREVQSRNKDGSIKEAITKQLYPNEARLKNLTYTIPIYCDIYFNYKIIEKGADKKENIIYTSKPILYEKISLGKIPCMLQSKGCVLSAIPRANLKEFGECPYDHGGYFIIDGKEKVITAQTRQIENKIYTKKNKPDDPIEYEAEIRSTHEDRLEPARIMRLYLYRPVQKKINPLIEKKMKAKEETDEKRIPNITNIKNGIIQVAVPNINSNIPLFILFRALGVTSDKDILQYICGDFENTKNSMAREWADYLYDNILLAREIRTQNEALLYIQNLINSPEGTFKKHHILEEDDYKGTDGMTKRMNYINSLRDKLNIDYKYIYDILYNWVFPHMGTNNLIEKATFLGYMTQELLKTKWEIVPTTSRDSYMYKRIDVSGFLIAQLFRDLYFRVKNEMTNSLNKHFNTLLITSGYELGYNEEAKEDNLVLKFVNKDNIWQYFGYKKDDKEFIITQGFRDAFKKCWGLKNASGCKEGVVQDLQRLTYLGMISHLRRVVTPLGATSKLRDPHMLNLSTYGILCPVETPDGGNVGVKTNIAIMTDITFGSHSGSIYQALLDNRLITLEQLPIGIIVGDKDLVKVVLNGRFVGYHKYPNLLVSRLRLLRRNALINIYTSIAWYIQTNEIKISTDSGRSCHPMLIVNSETNSLKITTKHLDGIRQGFINWYHLIAGRNDWNQYDHRYYRTDKSNYELDQNGGVIEFIDTEEANTIMLAMESHELVQNPNTRFTHCEIHPSIIFGIMGSIIPFVGTNQLPRNLYSCGQGKQAIGVYASNFRNRMDTKTKILNYPQKPLVQNRISKHLYNNILPYGQNAIIAIACYTGYNQDDSIIFNKSAVNRGLFRSVNYRTYHVREEQNEFTKQRTMICNPILIKESKDKRPIVVRDLKPGNYNKLDENGIVKDGVKVDENDIVCGKVIMTNELDENGNIIYKDDSTYVRRSESGFIDKVFYSHDNNDFLYVKIRLRKEKIPELGDKFASRAGQKGIMGMLLNEVDMPYTKNGIRPDMIINPQAFPKRMTISQFIETIECKECSLLGFFGDSSPFQTIPIEKIGDVLEKLGYERYGTEVLYNGMSGEQLESDIFIGPTYYERLQHQVEEKIHARADGSVTALNKQPTGGRAIGGGLRIGEMERDAILAHGVSGFLKETMTDRSDSTDVTICEGCGFIAMANPGKHIYHCYNCNSSKVYYKNGQMNKEQIENNRNNFQTLKIPYAMKLMTQELETMSVGMHLITKNTTHEWKRVGKYSNTETRETDLETLINLKDTGDVYYTKKSSKLDAPFRKYQNLIKNILINGAASYSKLNTTIERPSLIDLSAGRGGDLRKWIDSNYEYILALDIDKNGLFEGDECLKARYELIQNDKDFSDWFRNSKIEMGVNNSCLNLYTGEGFKDTDNMNKIQMKKILAKRGYHSFDVASIQFSTHYCFDLMVHLDGLLKNISNSLKPGGCAILTTFNGDSIYNILKKNNGSIDFTVDNQRLYSIAFEEDYTYDSLPNNEQGLNIRIKVQLPTTDKYITEYLVSPTFFISQAKRFGLRLMNPGMVSTYFNKLLFPFVDLMEPIGRLDKNSLLDEFLSSSKYRDLRQFSELYCYYIFVKDNITPDVYNNLAECSHAILKQKNEMTSYQELVYYRNLYGNNTKSAIYSSLRFFKEDELKSTIHIHESIGSDDLDKTVRNTLLNVGQIIYGRIKNSELLEYFPIVMIEGNLKTLGKYNDTFIDNVYEHIIDRYKLHPILQDNIIANPLRWRLTHCEVKTTLQQLDWSDIYYSEIFHMIASLCSDRKQIPDVELLLYKGTDEENVFSTNYDYPVLSFYKTGINNKLISIPNPIDWRLASQRVFKSNENGCESLPMPKLIIWNNKKNVGIFRGTLRGCPDTTMNMRMKFMENVIDYNGSDKIIPIDAKFNGISRELMDFMESFKGHFLEEDALEREADMSYLGQYKYIFCVDAFMPPMKLSYLLMLGSLVIRITRLDTDTNKPISLMWYDQFMRQYIFNTNNIDPVSADCIVLGDISLLPNLMDWCAKNPEICRTIAENGQRNIQKLIHKDAIYDYLYFMMVEINKHAPTKIEPKMSIERIYKEYKSTSYNLDVSIQLANIIEKNKDIIKNYYNLSLVAVQPTIIRIKHNDEIFKTVQLQGSIEINNAVRFIEDMINWEVMEITNIKQFLLENIQKHQKMIEINFNVYLIIDGNTIQIFGKNTQACYDYLNLSKSTEQFIELPWKFQRVLHLTGINATDLSLYTFTGSVAIVVPVVDLDQNSNHVKNVVEPIRQQLFNRNISFEVFVVDQTKYTTLNAIPAEIIAQQSDKGIELKHNMLGLLVAANKFISKSFGRIIVLDYCYITDFLDYPARLISLLLNKSPIIRSGYNYVINNRNSLNDVPNYLFGSTLQSIERIIPDIPHDEKTYYTMFKPVSELRDISLDKDYGYEAVSDMNSFSITQEDMQDNDIYNIYRVDYLMGALPLAIDMDKLKLKDNSIKELLNWTMDYLAFFLDKTNLKRTTNHIQIIRVEDQEFAKRLLSIMRQILLNQYGNIVNYKLLPTGHIQISLSDKPVDSIDYEPSILPFYTVNNKFYIRKITQDMIDELGDKIKELKTNLPHTPTDQKYPTNLKNKIFIMKMSHWVIFYNVEIDNVEFYNIVNNTFTQSVPTDLDDIDFNLVLVIFKDKNDSLLKAVVHKGQYNHSKIVGIHPKLGDLIISKAQKVHPEPTIDKKIVKNLLKLEPPISDLPEKTFGYYD